MDRSRGDAGTRRYATGHDGRRRDSQTKRQIDFPKNTPVANLYVEMLDRMSVKVDEFGDSKVSKNARGK